MDKPFDFRTLDYSELRHIMNEAACEIARRHPGWSRYGDAELHRRNIQQTLRNLSKKKEPRIEQHDLHHS